MDTIIEAFGYDFMRHAVVAGILASVLCGVIGTFVVVKRLVFISGGLSHAAFGGLGLFYYLGLNPIFGGILVAVLASAGLGLGATRQGRPAGATADAMIGVLWAVGMAIGILFIYQTPGYAPNLMTYLFGNILTVSWTDIELLCALDLVVLLIIGVSYKEFVAIAFDESFARVQGIPVRLLFTLFLVLVGLTVVMLIQVVGIILVIALLTIPPLIGLGLVRDFLPVMLVSVLVGVAMSLGGLALSFYYDVPSGPTIILLGALLLGLVRGGRRLLERCTR